MILLGESVVWQHLLLRLILACLDFALKVNTLVELKKQKGQTPPKPVLGFWYFLQWAFSLLIAQLYSRDGPTVFLSLILSPMLKKELLWWKGRRDWGEWSIMIIMIMIILMISVLCDGATWSNSCEKIWQGRCQTKWWTCNVRNQFWWSICQRFKHDLVHWMELVRSAGNSYLGCCGCLQDPLDPLWTPKNPPGPICTLKITSTAIKMIKGPINCCWSYGTP